MKKILFLDIDGVVCTNFDLRQDYYLGSDNALFEWYTLDPNCVQQLNEIVSCTNCDIVISSSWRKTFGIEELKDLFEQNGFLYSDNIVGTTGVFYDWIKPGLHVPSIRGLEIKVWLDLNVRKTPTGFTNNDFTYCIVDDDTDMLLAQLSNFVNTISTSGLTKENAQEIIRILNEQN